MVFWVGVLDWVNRPRLHIVSQTYRALLIGQAPTMIDFRHHAKPKAGILEVQLGF